MSRPKRHKCEACWVRHCGNCHAGYQQLTFDDHGVGCESCGAYKSGSIGQFVSQAERCSECNEPVGNPLGLAQNLPLCDKCRKLAVDKILSAIST